MRTAHPTRTLNTEKQMKNFINSTPRNEINVRVSSTLFEFISEIKFKKKKIPKSPYSI